MIVFSTNTDEQTNACHILIKNLEINSAIFLGAENAVKSKLEQELSIKERNIYAMSHGKHNSLIDNDSVPAIDTFNAPLLKERSVFAFACHTSSELGKVVATHQGNWFGYVGAIASPDSNEKGLEIFKPIFQYIFNSFTSVHTSAQCVEFIERVKDLCDTAELQVDSILDTTDDVGLSTYMCIRNIWERLRVWLANMDDFVAHQHATEALMAPNW